MTMSEKNQARSKYTIIAGIWLVTSAQPDDNVRKESSKQEANTPLLQEYGL